jgi:hypothetical protein
MERKPVTSSLIKSIGYENGEMHIEFSNGRVYSYTGPQVESHYNQLMSAQSIGKHFGANVRNCPHTSCKAIDS